MKFYGEFSELVDTVKSLGFSISFSGPKGDSHQIKTTDGGIVNWYESTGTVTCQGKRQPQKQLKERLEQAFQARCEISSEAGALSGGFMGCESHIDQAT